MKQHLAVSAIGSDRTGMVHELTRVISDCGGNIAESRMAALGSEFAMLLLVSGNWHALARIESELARLAETGALSVHVKRTEPRAARADMLPYSVDIVSLDQTGIVAGLSGFFASRGIDIMRGVDPQLCRGAHRRADVRGADDHQRSRQAAGRAAARGIHGLLRLTQSRCDSRAGQIMSAAGKGRAPPKRKAAPRPVVTIGQAVADFSLPATGGALWRLKDARGRKLVLYFYPRDNTPGCTLEGQQFAALAPRFAARRRHHRRHLARQRCLAREIPRANGLSVRAAVGRG